MDHLSFCSEVLCFLVILLETKCEPTTAQTPQISEFMVDDSNVKTKPSENSTEGLFHIFDTRLLSRPFQLSEDPDDIKFLLFRNPSDVNASEELRINDTDSIKNTGFNPKQKTVFLIHGFWSDSTSNMPTVIKKAYLEAGIPQNIIVVDWGMLSSPDPKLDSYSSWAYHIVVKKNIPVVYQRVGSFIQFLIDEQFVKFEQLHIVGHSLGAHVSGGTGYVIASNPVNGGRKVGRITGLDPAGPLFQGVRVQRVVSKDDADFVDIYHTAVGTLGSVVFNNGHANFFPNGGHHQPGCVDYGQPFLEAEFGSCSHSFVSRLYAASVTRKFKACQCNPRFIDYVFSSSCPGDCKISVFAGEPSPSSSRGQFYFETSEDPFKDGDEIKEIENAESDDDKYNSL